MKLYANSQKGNKQAGGTQRAFPFQAREARTFPSPPSNRTNQTAQFSPPPPQKPKGHGDRKQDHHYRCRSQALRTCLVGVMGRVSVEQRSLPSFARLGPFDFAQGRLAGAPVPTRARPHTLITTTLLNFPHEGPGHHPFRWSRSSGTPASPRRSPHA